MTEWVYSYNPQPACGDGNRQEERETETHTAVMSLSLWDRCSRKLLDGCFDFAGFDRTLSKALDGGTYCLPDSVAFIT